MTFILTLLLVWFLYWIIRFIWRVHRGYSAMRKQFQQFMGNTSGDHSQQHSAEQNRPRRREKIIPADYGEYIEFQEFALTGNEHFMLTASINYRLYRHERQIDDAVWEEIKIRK